MGTKAIKLGSFHTLVAPYFNTVDAADAADSQYNDRRPTAESPEIAGVG